MKVEKGTMALVVTFPNDEQSFVHEGRFEVFVDAVKKTAAQFDDCDGGNELTPFISVLDVFTAVQGMAVTSVELTVDGEYVLK